MLQTPVIKIIIFVFLFGNIQSAFSQEEEIKKKTVFLFFNDYKNNCKYDFLKNRLKLDKKEGIQFNLCSKEVLLHRNRMKRDTLCLWHLKDYKITKESELKEKERLWREKNIVKLKQRHGLLYRQINRNAVFDVNIIEKISKDKMVIYQVEFRYEGTLP